MEMLSLEVRRRLLYIGPRSVFVFEVMTAGEPLQESRWNCHCSHRPHRSLPVYACEVPYLASSDMS